MSFFSDIKNISLVLSIKRYVATGVLLNFRRLIQVGLHGGDPVDPDFRDCKYDSSTDMQSITAITHRHLPTLRTSVSVVEACMFTVSIYVLLRRRHRHTVQHLILRKTITFHQVRMSGAVTIFWRQKVTKHSLNVYNYNNML